MNHSILYITYIFNPRWVKNVKQTSEIESLTITNTKDKDNTDVKCTATYLKGGVPFEINSDSMLYSQGLFKKRRNSYILYCKANQCDFCCSHDFKKTPSYTEEVK